MSTDSTSSTQPQIQVPVAPSTELALTAVNALRAEMSIRHEAAQQRMDMIESKSRETHEDLVRFPTEVQKATSATREFLEQVIARTAAEISHVKGRQIEAVHGEITAAIAKLHGEIDTEIAKVRGAVISQLHCESTAELAKVRGDINTQTVMSDERFKSVQTQFTLLKQATEQLDLANKTAIVAALQAQKESAGETQKSSQAAIAKSELSTSEAIKALTVTVEQRFNATTDRMNEIKSRIDRGEGGRNVTDPAMAETIQDMMRAITALQDTSNTSAGKQAGKDYTMAIILTGLGIAIPAIALMIVIISRMR